MEAMGWKIRYRAPHPTGFLHPDRSRHPTRRNSRLDQSPVDLYPLRDRVGTKTPRDLFPYFGALDAGTLDVVQRHGFCALERSHSLGASSSRGWDLGSSHWRLPPSPAS